jgi:adenylate cyclase
LIYRFEDFSLDGDRRELRRGNEIVAVEPQVFDVLEFLIVNRERVVSNDELIRAVWQGRIVSDGTVSTRINAVRHALGDSGTHQRLIRTLPRKGYRFAGDLRPDPGNGKSDDPATIERPDDLLALGSRPSIAVLPFANFSADAEQTYFADGITEDITSGLCRLKGFLVIARNTMSAYKGQLIDVRRLGHELGVRYVLEGSVRRTGDDIRVTAQLLETEGGNHLWAERYDRKLEHIFAIQDEITASIVGRLGPELLAAEYARVRRKPTHSLGAWECVIRALHHSSQQSESESRKALEFLDRALQHDADYAQALGMKAWLLIFRAFQGWEDMGQVLRQAESLIARALAVDNDELWPYLAQGMVGYATRDNELSMVALTRAVELSPNSVNAHGLLGNAHAFGGRSAEALACIKRAMRLSPRDTYLSDFELYQAFAYFQGAQYGAGLKFAQQAHRLRPGHAYPLLLGASCAGHLGNVGTGASLLLELKSIIPIVSPAWVEATSPYVLSEDRARLVEGLVRVGLQQ